MPITPDTKDWTWVVEERCPECGFVGDDVEHDHLGGLVRAVAAPWRSLLERDDLEVRRRDDRWSDLEYSCHVRDVFRLYEVRLHLMLDEDDPLFPDWDQDASAEGDDYRGQDPATVVAELEAAAVVLAASFDAVEGEEWDRTGTRSDGARFTVDTFGRYFIHDPIHHLHDVGLPFAARA
jgi:hypothetical protein